MMRITNVQNATQGDIFIFLFTKHPSNGCKTEGVWERGSWFETQINLLK